jgi:hypothetical protein
MSINAAIGQALHKWRESVKPGCHRPEQTVLECREDEPEWT